MSPSYKVNVTTSEPDSMDCIDTAMLFILYFCGILYSFVILYLSIYIAVLIA